MKSLLSILLLLLCVQLCYTQDNWTWTALKNLPIPITKNALCEAITPSGKFVYSFGGITDSLSSSTVQNYVFKYDVSINSWSSLSPIPDTGKVIDNFASFVKGKIYLIGGKYVINDTTFISSEKVHVYNPITDQFEADGSNMLLPVSGQVQSVWRDSLIYVISGKSNGVTVPNVQIFNPINDTWISGTSIPDSNVFKTFGASGYILGDTIYYFGGAIQSPNTKAVNFFRKGIINPNNPSQIDWLLINKNYGSPQYRSACSGHDNTIFWVGGSNKVYDFNLLNFEDSLPVTPNQRLMEINVNQQTQLSSFDPLNNIMDLGGIAKIGGGNWIIAGGIDSLHQLSDKTFLLHNTKLSDIKSALKPPFFNVFANKNGNFIIKTDNIGKIVIYDMSGRIYYSSLKNLADLIIPETSLPPGILLFVYNNSISLPVYKKVFNP